MPSDWRSRVAFVRQVLFVGVLVCAVLIAAAPEDALANPAADQPEAGGMARDPRHRQVTATGSLADADNRRQLLGSRRKRVRDRNAAGGATDTLLVHSWAARSPLAAARSASRQAARAVPTTVQQPREAPDGYLVSWRKHANGNIAAVVGHYDGGLTARSWPQCSTFVTGLTDLAKAQALADEIAHADCTDACCNPWRRA